MDARAQRIAGLLAEIDAGEVEPRAMTERYGMTPKDARRAVAAAQRRAVRAGRKSEAGRVKGLWMRRETEAALVALGKSEGGQGRALAVAVDVIATIRRHQSRGVRQFVVELDAAGRVVVRPVGAAA